MTSDCQESPEVGRERQGQILIWSFTHLVALQYCDLRLQRKKMTSCRLRSVTQSAAFCYSSRIKLLTPLLKADITNYSEELTNENVAGLSHQRAHRPSESQMKNQQCWLVTARETKPKSCSPKLHHSFSFMHNTTS